MHPRRHRWSLFTLAVAATLFAGTYALAKGDPLSPEQQNHETFKKILEAGLNAHNVAIFDTQMAATMVDHDLPPGTPPGPAGTKAKLGAFLEAFPDIHFTFENEVYQGDKLAGRGYFTGTHKGTFNGIPPTGKQVKVPFMDLWRFENGKVVEYWGQPDRLSLMMQLGVIPQPKN